MNLQENQVQEQNNNDPFDIIYGVLGQETRKAMIPTLKRCLKDIKGRCLQCKSREIIKVMECKDTDCSLWELRKVIMENG